MKSPVFTSKLNSFADPILERLDPKAHYITHRLCRVETHYKSGVHLKDLSALNRDLSKDIGVVKDEQNVSTHLANALIIPEWTSDPNNIVLLDLIHFLVTIVVQNVRNVRDELTSFKVGAQGDIESAFSKYKTLIDAKQAGRVTGLFGRRGAAQATPVEEEEGPKRAVRDPLGRTGKLLVQRLIREAVYGELLSPNLSRYDPRIELTRDRNACCTERMPSVGGKHLRSSSRPRSSSAKQV